MTVDNLKTVLAALRWSRPMATTGEAYSRHEVAIMHVQSELLSQGVNSADIRKIMFD